MNTLQRSSDSGYGRTLEGVVFKHLLPRSSRLDADRKSLPLFLKKVVTGAGFPEPRRVRLLLSEDLSHYLSAAGQQPLASSSAPLSLSPRAGFIDEGKPGVDQTRPSLKKEVGESKSADKRRKSGDGSGGGEKGASTLKVRGSEKCMLYDKSVFRGKIKELGRGGGTVGMEGSAL